VGKMTGKESPHDATSSGTRKLPRQSFGRAFLIAEDNHLVCKQLKNYLEKTLEVRVDVTADGKGRPSPLSRRTITASSSPT